MDAFPACGIVQVFSEYDRVLLANSFIRKVFATNINSLGRVRPWLSTRKTPSTPRKSDTIPTSGITLAITAVKESRPGQIPLLKLYDSFDPVVCDPLLVRYLSQPQESHGDFKRVIPFFHTRKVARKRLRIVYQA